MSETNESPSPEFSPFEKATIFVTALAGIGLIAYLIYWATLPPEPQGIWF